MSDSARDALAAFRYYLILQLVAAAALPLCFAVGRRLTDRGWALSKVLGPLLVTYVCWLGGHGLWPFAGWSLWLMWVWLVLLSVSVYLFYRSRGRFVGRLGLGGFVRARWRLVGAIELVFLLGFIGGCALRALGPDVTFDVNRWASEKFFDFGLFNNLYLNQSFPVEDSWMAGHSINYYYFGHLIFAALGRLSGLPSGLAVNVTMGAVAAMTAALSFSLAHQLTRSIRWSLLGSWLVVGAGNLEPLVQIRRIVSELLKPAFAGELGLFGGLIRCCDLIFSQEFWHTLFERFYFWASSRVIPDEMITEFPAFSFLLGDPHAHVLALPLALATLLVVLSLVRWAWATRRVPANFVLRPLPLWLLLALLFGTLSAANLWDYYSLSLVAALVLGGALLRDARRHPWTLALGMLTLMLLVLFGRQVLFTCFHWTFQAPFDWRFDLRQLLPPRGTVDFPVKIVPPELRSPLGPFLLHWGLLLLAPMLYFVPRAAGRLVNCDWPKFCFFLGLLILVALGGYNAGQTWSVTVVLLFLLTLALYGRWPRAGSLAGPAALLLASAAALMLAVEFVFFDDVFDGVNERMVTLFKLSYPVWPLLTLGGVWCWSKMLAPKRGGPPRGGGARWGFKRSLLAAVFSVTVTLGALYPIFGVGERLAERELFGGRAGTLDGLRHLEDDAEYADDYALARWMIENLPRGATLVEACGGSYSPSGRFAVWTGLPSVMGWTNHEISWRGVGQRESITQRSDLTRRFYDTADPAYALALKAEYVIWGSVEQTRFKRRESGFSAPACELFHQEGESELYRLVRPVENE